MQTPACKHLPGWPGSAWNTPLPQCLSFDTPRYSHDDGSHLICHEDVAGRLAPCHAGKVRHERIEATARQHGLAQQERPEALLVLWCQQVLHARLCTRGHQALTKGAACSPEGEAQRSAGLSTRNSSQWHKDGSSCII